jgi:hypothetical protein
MKPLLGFFLFLLLATVVGCSMGKKPTYANVKGTVTFNDKPIEKGQITFAAEGGPPSTMDIVDGKFSGQALVGSNRISVSAKKKSANAPKLPKNAEIQIKGYQEKFRAAPGEAGGSTGDFDTSMVEYIPPEWGTQSNQMRVVEAGQTNELQFDIRGPNKN